MEKNLKPTKKVLDKKTYKKIVHNGDINRKNSNIEKQQTKLLKNTERKEELEKQKIIKKDLEKHLEKVTKRQAELAILVKNSWDNKIGEENDELAKEAEVIGRQLDAIAIEYPELELEKEVEVETKEEEIDTTIDSETEVVVKPIDEEKEVVLKPENAEEKNDHKLEGKEIPPVAPISPEKMNKLEQILGEAEAKKALELESSKFKNGILKGLSKWETLGQGEQGVKGFAKRMTKAGINLALIGAISMVAVDQLAVAGIGSASALAGGITSKLGTKMIFGMSIAGVLDVSGKGMSEKTKKRMPIYLALGGMGLAVGLSAISGAGFLAMAGGGAVAGLAAGAGYAASKLFKGKFTDEKIASKKEIAIKELFSKYTNEGGDVDVNRIPELEIELTKILKKFENQRIWGKLADGAMKLGIGSLVSGLTMEASGAVQDHVAADHQAELKHEAEVKHQNEVNHEKGHQTTEGPEILIFKPVTVSFNSHGGIATINDMKAEIHHEYPDITKAPESVQEFAHSDSVHMAIKIGLYDPNNPNGDESSMLSKDSILGFDQKGDLYIRDSHTGQSEFLMQSKDGVETITKFDGKMFDSDHSAMKVENHPVSNIQEQPNENPNAEQSNPTTETTQDAIPVTPDSLTPITTEHTPVTIVEHPQEGAPVVTPEAEKLIDFKFDNPNHIIPITENGGTLEMKFIYDAGHHIIGTDVSGNYHVDTDQYIDQVKLHELSGFDQGDASRDIFEMAKEAIFLDKLPHNTAEYQQVHQHVMEMQKSITDQYGDILNHTKIENDNSIQLHSANETPTTSHNTETVAGGFTLEQTLQIETVTHNNIEHIYPQEGNQYNLYWDDVKNLRADVLFHMNPVAEKFQATQDYINKIHEVLGIEPKEPTIITSAEKIGEFFTRASEEAAKQGKVDQIEIK